jgi:glycerol uptake facilitator-like aquaporin
VKVAYAGRPETRRSRTRRIAFREAVFGLCTAGGAWLGFWLSLPLDVTPQKHGTVSEQISHAMIPVVGPALAGAVIGGIIGFVLSTTLPGLRTPR